MLSIGESQHVTLDGVHAPTYATYYGLLVSCAPEPNANMVVV